MVIFDDSFDFMGLGSFFIEKNIDGSKICKRVIHVDKLYLMLI